MLVIGERINATRKTIKEALSKRDEGFIAKEAKDQAEAGADYIDVNGGTTPEEELDNMLWLVEVVQDAVDLPLCLDSSSPDVISEALKHHKNGRAMINSVSMEEGRHEALLPLVKENDAMVVALAMDDTGIPRTANDRLLVIEKLVEKSSDVGIPLSDIYIDPLVMALSADITAGKIVVDVLRGMGERWPDLNSTCGLSNISFGLPKRSLVNRTYLSILAANGLSSAIIDPLDEKMMAEVTALRALLGKDDYCMEFISAFRAGKLGD